MTKILSIVGVRPQFVKAAMICAAVERYNHTVLLDQRIEHKLLNTGQHYDFEMAEVFFQELPLRPPDFNLNIGSGTHGAQTGSMLQRVEQVLVQESPGMVIVYGDTNSTLAGALAAAKLHIPVAHVESGLRSFNRSMPEEINRIATDHISDVLLCPTRKALEQLARENITANVHFTGDVMLDAVVHFASGARKSSNILNRLGLTPKQFILVTVHRAENTDSLERMEQVVDTLCSIPYPMIFAMHPRLRAKLNEAPDYARLNERLRAVPHLNVIAPVCYLDMLHLETNAQVIMTDSGGVQKEAYFLETPCLTLRDETEWVETLQGDWNRLVGTSPKAVLPLVRSLFAGNGASPEGKPDLSKFGGGAAADRILELLLQETHSIAYA